MYCTVPKNFGWTPTFVGERRKIGGKKKKMRERKEIEGKKIVRKIFLYSCPHEGGDPVFFPRVGGDPSLRLCESFCTQKDVAIHPFRFRDPAVAGEAHPKQVHPGKPVRAKLIRVSGPFSSSVSARLCEAVQDLEEEGGSDGPPSSRGKDFLVFLSPRRRGSSVFLVPIPPWREESSVFLSYFTQPKMSRKFLSMSSMTFSLTWGVRVMYSLLFPILSDASLAVTW